MFLTVGHYPFKVLQTEENVFTPRSNKQHFLFFFFLFFLSVAIADVVSASQMPVQYLMAWARLALRILVGVCSFPLAVGEWHSLATTIQLKNTVSF